MVDADTNAFNDYMKLHVFLKYPDEKKFVMMHAVRLKESY